MDQLGRMESMRRFLSSGGQRSHHTDAMCHGVLELPARGRPVQLHFRLPEAGNGILDDDGRDIHSRRWHPECLCPDNAGTAHENPRQQAYNYARPPFRAAAAHVVRLWFADLVSQSALHLGDFVVPD